MSTLRYRHASSIPGGITKWRAPTCDRCGVPFRPTDLVVATGDGRRWLHAGCE